MTTPDGNSWSSIVEGMTARGAVFAPGLSDQELRLQESACGFKFPPDLAEFLQYALPTGSKWPNWRGDSEEFCSQMSWPLEGILFDIEWNEFWAPSWGQRPDDLSEAKRIATEQVNAAPTLVPVVGHRYIPSEPCIAGNPVLSVYQTDIIVYADNLQNVLRFDYHPGVGERSQFAPGFQLSTHARDS